MRQPRSAAPVPATAPTDVPPTAPEPGETPSPEAPATQDHQAVVARAIGLTKTYGAAAVMTALDHVSVDLERGRLTAIMGPSGSGKSTLLHCLAALDAPTSGQVVIDGVDVSRLKDRALTRL